MYVLISVSNSSTAGKAATVILYLRAGAGLSCGKVGCKDAAA